MPGAFVTAAADYVGHGLAVIPCGGEDGKRPLIRNWSRWRHPPGRDALRQLELQFPEANIALLTGLSNLLLVDVDDTKEVVRRMIDRFGETPVISETPSDHAHLWFRANGEAHTNLRPEGFKVDILAGPSIAVCPPSIRPSGPHRGKAYRFLAGGLDLIGRLPCIRAGSLTGGVAGTPNQDSPLREGERNATLYRLGREHASRGRCANEDALRLFLRDLNRRRCRPVLADSEVVEIASKAWKRRARRRSTMTRRDGFMQISNAEMYRLAAEPDALVLLNVLRLAHQDGEQFSIMASAMWQAGTIPGWARDRYERARDLLVDAGLLVVVRRGAPGRRGLFRLADTLLGDPQ